ncbi:flagellin [Enterovirga sp. CN4-39]|uniref:flagellin N-terminal helical domain-containing protein n=1 Tax=Enterovirga sp. CN4-39 TaxID=3400910 RepID=UPI003C04C15B
MANGIVLSSSVRTNLLSLQDTTTQQGIVQNRLATGKKVISALDNPTNFFTSAGLTQRANDLAALLDGISNGVKTLEAASNGATSITKVIESMQANVRQARQDKSFKGTSFTLDTLNMGSFTGKTLSFSGGSIGTTPVTIDAIVADIGGSRTSQSTTAAYAPPATAAKATYTAENTYAAPGTAQALDLTFNGVTTSVSVAPADTTVGAAVSSINAQLAAAGRTDIEAFNAGGNLQIRTTANVDGSVTVAGAGETAIFGAQVSAPGSDGLHSFSVNGTQVTLTPGQVTVGQAVAKANADLGPTHAFEAFDDGGKLGFRAKSAGVTALSISNTAGSTAAGMFDAAVAGTAPTTPGRVRTVDELATAINEHPSLVGKVRASLDGGKLRIENLSTTEMTIAGASATGINGGAGASNTTTIGGNEIRKNLITQFNDLRDQLDKIAGDAGFNGVNILRGDKLRVVFNERGTSSIDVEAKNKTGLSGVSTASNSLNISAVTEEEYSNDELLDARLNALKESMTTLQAQSSQLGANLSVVQIRQDFTKHMITTLQTGSDFLVNADMNEEGANLLALNTRQQLSQTALSLASQADQAVLRLFG